MIPESFTQECEYCHGQGWIDRDHEEISCTVCGGSGWMRPGAKPETDRERLQEKLGAIT